MLRRKKEDIYLDVLQVMKQGQRKPTHIMYKSNISWDSLLKMLDNMKNEGHVLEVDTDGIDKRSSKEYEITGKGENFLVYCRGPKGLRRS